MGKKEKVSINPDEESQKQPKILERWGQPYIILDMGEDE